MAVGMTTEIAPSSHSLAISGYSDQSGRVGCNSAILTISVVVFVGSASSSSSVVFWTVPGSVVVHCVGHSGHSSAISVTIFVGVSLSAHSGPVRWLRLLWPPLSGRLFRSRFIRSFFVRPPLCILAVSSLSFRTFRPLFGRRSVPLSSPFWAILWSFVTVDFWPLWPLIVFHRHC